ncbi:hypothetical protein [Endozoicomonas elysicola]|nr:hypothetical protein [Endozoicomonas elysicola]
MEVKRRSVSGIVTHGYLMEAMAGIMLGKEGAMVTWAGVSTIA